MPKTELTHETEFSTRNNFTKVEAEITLSVKGRELPTTAVLGAALEKAVGLIQSEITNSYQLVVPSPTAEVIKNA